MMTQDDRDMLISIHEKVKSLDKHMYDNGQPGLITRFNKLETSHEECQFRQNKSKQWPAMVAALCAVIAVIWNFVG